MLCRMLPGSEYLLLRCLGGMHYRSGGGNRRNRRGEIVLGLNAEGGGRWERGRIATSHDEHRSRGSEEEGGRLRDGSSLFTAACLLARRSND